MKILIVDDDTVCRKILMIMLKNYGSCHQGASREDVVALFRQCLEEKAPYNVIFLEVALQGADGWEILGVLRKMEQEFGIMPEDRVKCIMISTELRQTSSDTMPASDYQWNGYLVKPISPEGLERELRRLELKGTQTKVCNKQKLMTLMIDVGDKVLVRELVSSFIHELPNKIIDMEKQLVQAQYSDIQKKAHKLVSLSGTYGFSQLSEILRNIEQGAVRGKEKMVGDGLILAMEEWGKIQEQLAQLLAVCEVDHGK